MTLFPFTLYGQNGCGGSPIVYEFHTLFMLTKPQDMTWFETDVIVHSPTKIQFDVYERGGSWRDWVRGERIALINVDCSPDVTRKAIQWQAIYVAEARIDEEARLARERQLAEYTNEILTEVYR